MVDPLFIQRFARRRICLRNLIPLEESRVERGSDYLAERDQGRTRRARAASQHRTSRSSPEASMKVYIVTDLEGVAAISQWDPRHQGDTHYGATLREQGLAV